jgi:hypothetical protein
MFLLNGQPLQLDIPFTHDDIQYPANWLRLSTPEEKAAIGITEVADPIRPDDRFYWVDGSNQGTPKDLTQLKADWTKQVDQIAYSLLFTTDWMVVRKAEVGTDIPADTVTYRTAVRAAAVSNRAAIANAADFDAFVSVVTALNWPTVTA